MVFMMIFNFLEPGVTIIAQSIPMFRVLVVNVKKSSNAIRISSPLSGGTELHRRNQHDQHDEFVKHSDVSEESHTFPTPC